ncbi:O-antigen polysaccharide polymerase Wzy [Micromonospora citrea]|uniref:O-antigen polysaccharide polymerase Wzy n=1 Tax=Micromonospora citrea TaxID=47855 RepID=UPI003C3C9B1E
MDLNNVTIIWLICAGAFAVPAVLLLRSGRRDTLPYLAAFFAYFGLGPVVNFALGNRIYSGAAQSKIGLAALGVLLALIGMLIVGFLLPARRTVLDRSRLNDTGRRYHLPPFLFLALAGYALVVIISRGTAGFSGSKLERIQQSGPWHYDFLLAQILCCALYFTATMTRFGKVTYWINFACYVTYCLLTEERDFIFVAFSILLHVHLFRHRPMSVRLLAAGSAGAIGAVVLAGLRGNPLAVEGDLISRLLNEGSTLFPDTFVMAAVPDVTPFAYGETYMRSLASLVPGAPSHSLGVWLVEEYNAGSASGYGFSLVAEAYLNFGFVGIPVLFALLTVVQRRLISVVDRGHCYAYASVLFTVTWMYNFRGESLAFLKTALYGAILFAVVWLFSTAIPGGKRFGEGSAAPSQPMQHRSRPLSPSSS